MTINNKLMVRYPSIDDLAQRARRRMPHFVWEFVDSGTGSDDCVRRNRKAFAAVTMTPQFMKGIFEPEIATSLFGIQYNAPFGIAPVGMSGLFWPGMENILARTAAKYRFPYALSTFANELFEDVAACADGMGWFQLYPPRNPNMRGDLLARAREAGFTTLLVTADVPVGGRRERQRRTGISAPPKITPSLVYQCAKSPAWTLATLRHGLPHFPGLEKYTSPEDMKQFLNFVGRELGGSLDWEYLTTVRQEWDGPIVLKGVLDVEQARQAVAIGLDGILVSNHGGRQFDGAPTSLEVLPAIAEAVGDKAKILLDSGVFSGLDIARAIALGADFVLLGRAFMYGVAALGERGGDHAADILLDDLKNNMSQLGCASLQELPARLS